MKVGPAVVQTLSSQAIQSAASLATGILIARGLGPVGQGGYAVFVAAIGLGTVVASFGQYEGNVLTSAGDANPGRVLLIRAGAHAAAVGLAFLALRPLWAPLATGLVAEVGAIFPLILALEVAALLLRGVNLGQHHVTAFNVASLLQRVVYLLTIVAVALLAGLALERVLLCWAVATAVSLAVSAGWAWVRSPAGTDTLVGIRQGWGASLRRGWRPLATIALTLVLIRFDVWTLGSRLGAGAVGQVSVASALVEWLWYVPTIVGTILFAAVAADRAGRRIETVAQSARLVVLLVGPASLMLMAVGRVLVPALYGSAYQEASAVFVRLVPGAAAVAVHLVIDTYFAGRGFPPVSLLAPAGCLLLKAILNTVLVPRYGIVGAATATSVVYVVLLTTKLMVLRAETGVPAHRFLLVRSADLVAGWTLARGWVSSRLAG